MDLKFRLLLIWVLELGCVLLGLGCCGVWVKVQWCRGGHSMNKITKVDSLRKSTIGSWMMFDCDGNTMAFTTNDVVVALVTNEPKFCVY